MKSRNFSSNLIIATMILQETQKMLHDEGDHDTSIAGILKEKKINKPELIIAECRKFVDWQDLDGKF